MEVLEKFRESDARTALSNIIVAMGEIWIEFARRSFNTPFTVDVKKTRLKLDCMRRFHILTYNFNDIMFFFKIMLPHKKVPIF